MNITEYVLRHCSGNFNSNTNQIHDQWLCSLCIYNKNIADRFQIQISHTLTQPRFTETSKRDRRKARKRETFWLGWSWKYRMRNEMNVEWANVSEITIITRSISLYTALFSHIIWLRPRPQQLFVSLSLALDWFNWFYVAANIMIHEPYVSYAGSVESNGIEFYHHLALLPFLLWSFTSFYFYLWTTRVRQMFRIE